MLCTATVGRQLGLAMSNIFCARWSDSVRLEFRNKLRFLSAAALLNFVKRLLMKLLFTAMKTRCCFI